MDAKFDYGEKVRVIKNIRNDGTFMGSNRGALLIRRGSEGYIKGVGKFLQDQVIYQVHFLEHGCTVGCRETELCDLEAAWVDRKFERGDSVIVGKSLSHAGTVVVKAGDNGTILGLQSEQKPFFYNVTFKSSVNDNVKSWLIPEKVLTFNHSLSAAVDLSRKVKREAKC